MLSHKTIMVEQDEFNRLLDKALEFREPIYGKPNFSTTKNNFRMFVYIHEAQSSIDFTTFDTKKNKLIQYKTYLDSREIIQRIVGLEAKKEHNKYHKNPVLGIDPPFGVKAILYSNPEYDGTRQYAYEYDLNSAWPYSAITGWIDTYKFPQEGKIGPNQIGFRDNDEGYAELVESGYSDYIFDKMDTPIGEKIFFQDKYEKKKTAKNKEEKQKYKDYMNLYIGILQHENPYLRAYIICKSNNFMKNLIDENTLYCNTDSIVSRVRRPDLEANMGNEIGQWKLDKEGMFAYKGVAYQWNKEAPSWRSVQKSRFENLDFDILTDTLPPVNNIYKFNQETNQLEVVEDGKTSSEKAL